MNGNTAFVIDWIKRMTERFGHTVYDDTQPTARFDWGQALCRECYGPDWSSRVGDDPTSDDVARAKDWEAGDWPEWAWTTKRRMEGVGQ